MSPRKSILATILITVIVCTVATSASASPLYELSTSGIGTADLSTIQKHGGNYSVKLAAPGPDGTGNVGRVRIEMPDVALNALEPFSYWVWGHIGYPAYAKFYIDVNGNGVWDGVNPDDYLTLEPYEWQWVVEKGTYGGVNFPNGIDNLVANSDPNTPPSWSPTGGVRGAPTWAPDTWLQVQLAAGTHLYSEAAFSPGGSFGIDDILYPWDSGANSWKAGTVPNAASDLIDGRGDSYNPNPRGIAGTMKVLYVVLQVDDWVKASECYVDDATVAGVLHDLEEGPSLTTATGSGYAAFQVSAGEVGSMTAVPLSSFPTPPPPTNFVWPHGFFSFSITGLTGGAAVVVTITLPSAMPVGTQYWKYGPTLGNPVFHWYQLPMGSDDGDNVITITLVDGGLGDDDLTANGVILDQGGPGNPAPAPVGGFIEPVNKLNVFTPYLALLGVMAAVAVVLTWKKPEN